MFPFVCVIYAITGFKTDVQQLAQMLGAAVVPGNSQANMCTFRFDVLLQQCSSCIVTGIPLHPAILYTRSGSIQTWHGTDRRALSSATDFTLYGYNSCAQGLSLARDLKMGQYCKLPPIANVIVQIIGTIIGAPASWNPHGAVRGAADCLEDDRRRLLKDQARQPAVRIRLLKI